MKIGDLVIHAKGTVYPKKYLLGIITREILDFGSTYEVLWFHTGRKQLCLPSVLIRLEDYESR